MGLTRIRLDRKTRFTRAKALDPVPGATTFRTDVSAPLRRLWVPSCLKAEAATDEKGGGETWPRSWEPACLPQVGLGSPRGAYTVSQDIGIREATLWPDRSRQSKTIL